MADIDELIGKVAEQNGIRLERNDPAFALVTLNEAVLRDIAKDLQAQMQSTIDGFAETVRRLDARTGVLIAQEVRQSASEFRQEMQKDLASASLQARNLVSQVNAAHRRPVIIRWMTLGLFCGLILFVLGAFVGRWSAGGI